MLGFLKRQAPPRAQLDPRVESELRRIQNLWNFADLEERTSLLKRAINIQDDRLFLAYVHATWTQIPEKDRILIIGEYIRRDGNEELIKVIGKTVANCFSAEFFKLVFDQKTLVTNWTYEDALAIWYCLGRFCFLVALGSVEGLPDTDGLNVAAVGNNELIRIWNMSEATLKRFWGFNETKLSSMFSLYVSLGDGEMLGRFFALVVSEILGYDVSFSAEDFSKSHLVQILEGREIDMDSALHVKISSLFVTATEGVRKQFSGYKL